MIPILAVSAGLSFCPWPWGLLLTHELVLALIGSILVDCSLYSFRKIPFTCAYLPGKSQVHLMFWFGLIPLMVMIHKCARAELDAIQTAAGCCMVVLTLAVVAFALRKAGDLLANRGDWEIEFEDPPPGALIGLNLNR